MSNYTKLYFLIYYSYDPMFSINHIDLDELLLSRITKNIFCLLRGYDDIFIFVFFY